MPKVTFTENGQVVEKEFSTESEAKDFKKILKSKGIKGKWEW